MDYFKKILVGFFNGSVPAEQAQRALAELLLRNPELTQPCIEQLNHLYSERRLNPQLYSMFREALLQPEKFRGDELDPLKAFDDASVESGDDSQSQSPSADTGAGESGIDVPDVEDGDEGAGKTVFRTPTKAPVSDDASGKTQFRSPTTGYGAPTGSHTGAATGGFTGSQTGGTGMPVTGTSRSSNWSSPSAWTGGAGGAAGDEPVTVGSIIKNRFVLEELIGRGGMGMVYKARDLRKEEAQDRFPYVALKVLNEEFKQHPESLKALQRESRKAQELAHPNIVNVHDFDRDGGNVFMTMELLEGSPLDLLVRKQKGSGMSWKEALPIIKGMALALDYAHRKNIIHSDFKPANCFLKNDGTVKVFDFGIARAAKRTGELKGEETKFDAGTLGALTPAYATCEMIDGEEPDQRDDIYALACTIYELLSGKHPYNKLSAAEARKRGLVPKPIQGLSRSRFRALLQGLALTREKRTASAFKLLEELNPRETNKWLTVGAGSAAVLLLAVTAIVMVPNYLYEKNLAAISVELGSPDFSSVMAAVESLNDIEPDDRQVLLSNASDQIIAAFDAQIGQSFNRELDLYDYPRARMLLDKLGSLYPDSSRVTNVEEQIERDRQELQAELSADYDSFLEARQLLPQDGDDIYDLRDIVAQIDPGDQLLQDARLPQALAAEARVASAQQDFDTAERYLNVGLELVPDDADLINVRDEVRTQRNAIERAAEIATLEARLQPLTRGRLTAEDIASAQLLDDLRDLSDLQPGSAILKSVRTRIQNVLAQQVDADLKVRNWQGASDRFDGFGDMLEDSFIQAQTTRIDDSRRAFEEKVISLVASIDKAIAAGQLDQPRNNNAMALLADLQEAGASEAEVSAARDRIANGYIDAARTARSQNDWNQARTFADKATDLQPSDAVLVVVRDEIAKVDNQETLAVQELQDREITGIQARVDKRLGQETFGRGDIDAVLVTVNDLDSRFGQRADVKTFVNGARSRVADRIAEQSMDFAQAGRWDDANALIVAGEDALGQQQILTRTRTQIAEFRRDQESRVLGDQIRSAEESLAALLKSADLDDTWNNEFDRQVALLEKLESGNVYAIEARERAAGLHLVNARELREASRWIVAQQQLERAQALAPNLPSVQAEADAFEAGQVQYQQQLAAAKQKAEIDAKRQLFNRQLQAQSIDRAEATLNELRKLLDPNDVFLTTTAPDRLVDGRLKVAAANAAQDRYTTALKQIDLAAALGTNDLRLDDARAQFTTQRSVYGIVNSGGNDEVRALAGELAQLQSVDGYAAFESRLQRVMKRRIEERASSNRQSAEALYAAAKTPFPALDVSWPEPERAVAEPSVTTPPIAPVAVVAPPTQAPSRAPAKNPPVRTVSAGGKPCTAAIAGLGKSRNCYDNVGEERLPILVVVPGLSGGGDYAISRSEVSRKDYNLYCQQSGQCSGLGGSSNLPATNLDVGQITAYVEWLSAVSGRQYQLPTLSQWQHAARAGGGTLTASINCVRNVGGRQADGFELVNVSMGGKARANDWGLRQVVGNAEEVVVDGGSYKAAGGAYSDRVSDCTPDFTRSFSGASERSGFRVARNID